MMHAEATRTRVNTSAKIGASCAALGLTAVTSVLGLWLFGTAPELRRQLVTVFLGCALTCVVVVALRQRSSGGWRPRSDVAAAACAEASEETNGSTAEPVSVPRALPS